MIPVASDRTTTNTLPGRRVAFTIDPDAMARVMGSLSELYSDSATAVAREYSTNAWDEHVKIGTTRPIEVTLPTVFNHFFTVRDYGVGMSEDILENVYTHYGTSTKTHSNDFNGVLGYGSKSALAYTDTFTVASINDGVKTEVVISRESDGSIVMDILGSHPTAEPSGTLVTVPVHDIAEFEHKARRFYRFWKPGTVLINGTQPEQAVGTKLTDDLYYSGEDNSYVVMGNVGYRITNPGALFRDLNMNNINFVAYVPNGSVEFTPSREDLKYTDHTKATLAKVAEDFSRELIERAKFDIDNAANHFDAYSAWMEWRSKIGPGILGDLTFQGDALVTDFAVPGGKKLRVKESYYYGRSRRQVESVSKWPVEKVKDTFFVTNYSMSLGTDHKLKAKEYLSLKGIHDATSMVFTSADSFNTPWVDPSRVVSWTTLTAAIPKATRTYAGGPRRIKGTFDYYTPQGWVTEKELPTSGSLFFVTKADDNNHNVQEIARMRGMSNYTIVVLAANRIEKFKRDNLRVRDFMDESRKAVVIDAETLVPDSAKTVISLDYEESNWLNRLDISRINDPKWATVKAAHEARSNGMERYEANLNLARLVGLWYTVKRFEPTLVPAGLLRDYPLLSDLRHYASNKEHIYLYINAAYAAKEGI